MQCERVDRHCQLMSECRSKKAGQSAAGRPEKAAKIDKRAADISIGTPNLLDDADFLAPALHATPTVLPIISSKPLTTIRDRADDRVFRRSSHASSRCNQRIQLNQLHLRQADQDLFDFPRGCDAGSSGRTITAAGSGLDSSTRTGCKVVTS